MQWFGLYMSEIYASSFAIVNLVHGWKIREAGFYHMLHWRRLVILFSIDNKWPLEMQSWSWGALHEDYVSLARYVILRVAHAPGMSGTFSQPPTSKETASKRSRLASWMCYGQITEIWQLFRLIIWTKFLRVDTSISFIIWGNAPS